jgi:asparagine synthase (glutamine-hydrolysing)
VCGIAGAVQRGRVDPDALQAMACALAHRGPDGEGTALFDPFSDPAGVWQAGLSHRRLAVFDPSEAGAQPMTSRSGRITLVLNGEVYNHPELRRRLPDFRWRTRTDTEVLLELLEAFGPDVLEQVNGMFAFAAWDLLEHRLWIARDRIGVKPLFYRASSDGVVFASELAVILCGADFPRRIDRSALSSYLDFGFVPAPGTILEGVSKLEPGSLLEWSKGRTRVSRWWKLPPASPSAASPSGWRESLYAGLVDAVRLRLRSDVPVGSFLSGGLDSSLVTALAVRECPELRSYSVCFPEAPVLDESRHARAAARALGTRHREIPVTGEDVVRGAPRILSSIDEPLADSSLVPSHILSGAAREEVTVALAGDGADELFAGYRRYHTDRWLAYWQRIPPAARRRLVEPVLRRLPDHRGTRLGEFGRRAQKLLDVDGLSPEARALSLARIFREQEKLRLLSPDRASCSASMDRLRELRAAHRGRDELDTHLRVDLALGLPDDMLTKVDRASMAHGLEVRVPFLDHRVVEQALRLPSSLKLHGGRSKIALHDVFEHQLPRAVRRRRKAGFDAPLSGWLRGSLRELVRDTLAVGRLKRGALLDADEVNSLVDSHERRIGDHGWRIWSLVVLCDWAERHLAA